MELIRKDEWLRKSEAVEQAEREGRTTARNTFPPPLRESIEVGIKSTVFAILLALILSENKDDWKWGLLPPLTIVARYGYLIVLEWPRTIRKFIHRQTQK